MARGAGIRTFAALLLALNGASACAASTVGRLPPGTRSEPAATSPRLYVVVADDGALSVAGAPTTLERLPADLDAAFKRLGATGKRADQTVMIVGGPTITYGTVMGLVLALKAAGWTRIGEATVGADR